MKYLFPLLLLYILLLSSAFARLPCSGIPFDGGLRPFLDLSKDTLISTCIKTREEYKCQDLEADYDPSEKQRVIQCNAKSLEDNRLGNTSIADCVIDGIKISAKQLLELKELPGKIAEGVIKKFHEDQECNISMQKKKELLERFNLTISDPLYKMDSKFLSEGRWLENVTCSELDRMLSTRYQNFVNVQSAKNKVAVDTGKKINRTNSVTEDKSDNFMLQLKAVFNEVGVRYECYTPKFKAEMLCAGVTSLVVDAALGMGVKSAITKVTTLIKSKKALAAIAKAKSMGEKADLKDAAKLTNGDRKKAAEIILDRKITKDEGKAIIDAHNVGLKEGRGFDSYLQEDITSKTRKLASTKTIDSVERRELMENGITGTNGIELKFGETVRSKGQKKIGEAFEVGNKEKVKEGLVETKNYFSELQNLKDADFKKVFPADIRTISNIAASNQYGVATKEAANTVERFISVHGLDQQDTLRVAINNLSKDIEEYGAMAAKKSQPMVEYKIYRDKELKAELMERYFTKKYTDKYNDLDFEKMSSKEQQLLMAVREDLRKAREEATRRKWPMDAK